MQKTSKTAYAKREQNGKNITDRITVYTALTKLKFGTKGDIARFIKWPQEAVHKRLSELKNEGHIKATNYKKVDPSTGHLQNIWAVKGTKEIKLKIA